MLYLASTIATSAVRLSDRLAPSRSRRVLTYHCPIVSSCLLCLLLPSWFSTFDGSAVFGNPGDGRSGMEFRAVVHFMDTASKKCWSAAGFCKLLATLSRGTNRGITPSRTCQDRRKLFVPAVAGRNIRQWFTTANDRGVKLPKVLQYRRYCSTGGTATPPYHTYYLRNTSRTVAGFSLSRYLTLIRKTQTHISSTNFWSQTEKVKNRCSCNFQVWLLQYPPCKKLFRYNNFLQPTTSRLFKILLCKWLGNSIQRC